MQTPETKKRWEETMQKFVTKKHAEGVEKLKAMGINTIADLDAYREKTDPYNSRWAVLSAITGNDAADWILNDLAINSCTR